MMVEMHLASLRCRTQLRLRLLFSLLSLVLVMKTVNAQGNITLDDTDMYIIYSPATSWHASTVPCASCLLPENSTAFDGTWHDGTHVVPTIDKDDGDIDGDGTSSNSITTSVAGTSSVSPTTTSSESSAQSASSSASVQPAQTSTVDDDSDDDDSGDKNGKGGGGGGQGKNGKRGLRQRGPLYSAFKIMESKRDGSNEENPFETQGNDSDDSGFQDVPVTATLNFSGTAIYLFSILPLFPAPANTNPTATNLSFTLDGKTHVEFLHLPDATEAGTPTVNSSVADKYLPNFNVFSASGLNDTAHTLVVNVGVDSVFLFDYAMYTSSASDSGSSTTTALGSQLTGGSNAMEGPLFAFLVFPSTVALELTMSSTPSFPSPTITSLDSSAQKHNVATFAGAVGGSVGFLSILALGLCISIRYRRRRASQRERRINGTFAETFTARDHGAEPDEDEEESVFRRRVGANGSLNIAQTIPAHFVPRYFPGSTPASPPPYVADGPSIPVQISAPLMSSINRAGLPVAIPSAPPASITLPTPTLDLQRTSTGSSSYADRPPPTPLGEEMRITFSIGGAERNLNGGIVGLLPIDSPSAEENDPMLGLNFDGEDDAEERQVTGSRRLDSQAVTSASERSSTIAHSRESGLSAPSEAAHSLTDASYTTSSQSTSSTSATPSTHSLPAPSGLYPILNTSTSLPSLSSFRPSGLSSPSQPGLAPKPGFVDGPTTIAYPLLRPSRVPLPPSIYGSDAESREALERSDSRT